MLKIICVGYKVPTNYWDWIVWFCNIKYWLDVQTTNDMPSHVTGPAESPSEIQEAGISSFLSNFPIPSIRVSQVFVPLPCWPSDKLNLIFYLLFLLFIAMCLLAYFKNVSSVLNMFLLFWWFHKWLHGGEYVSYLQGMLSCTVNFGFWDSFC